jgi:hypothetical protein
MNEEKPNQPTKKPAATAERAENGPAHVVREGAIAASIWKRQTNTGHQYYEFTLSRSWKSTTSDRTGYSPNFSDKNKAALCQVVEAACAWIAERNAEQPTDSARESLAA